MTRPDDEPGSVRWCFAAAAVVVCGWAGVLGVGYGCWVGVRNLWSR